MLKHPLALAVTTLLLQNVWHNVAYADVALASAQTDTAQEQSTQTDKQNRKPSVVLDALKLTTQEQTTNLLGDRHNISNNVIQSDSLKQRATTLGDALDGELGIHSNQFGGGASAPIIRGQEGKRVTILQNNADVIDMSHLSPDHAVMVDTVLARQAEVIRGVSNLLYKSGNSAGVVNIIDKKIPDALPTNPFESEVGIRYNTGNDEKLTTAAITTQLGENFVLHAEGLYKKANNYQTPAYTLHKFKDLDQLDDFVKAPKHLADLEKEYDAFKRGEKLHWKDEKYYLTSEKDYLDLKKEYTGHITDVKSEKLDYLPESWANSKAGSLGLSWVNDNGYIGVAVSERKDKYGLPAHNHLYEGCGVISIFDSLYNRPYLARYPQLINTDDINYINPRPDCADHATDNLNHSHGVQSKHGDHASPYVDLTTRRYDVRGEWHNPAPFIDKIRSNLGYVNYQHDEKEGNIVTTSFKNKGKIARLEFTHTPSDNVKALWGIQHTEQDNQGLSPQTEWRKLPLLTQNTLKNSAIFGMGQYAMNNVELEFGTRLEKQTVAMDYDTDYIVNIMKQRSQFLKGKQLNQAINDALEATKPHQKTASSYALGVNWHFLPKYTLSFNVSHQERLPNSQELYAHGMHLATNSFEIGNRHLTKERSNNYELGLKFNDKKLNYKVAGYLYDFDNYIYLSTINEHLGTEKVNHFRHLRINHYDQSPAKFYGVEGQIDYQFNPKYRGLIFADYVKGKLHNLPPIVSDINIFTKQKTYSKQADRYTPRLPPMRFGAKAMADFNDKWSASVEYVRTFDQHKVSKFEAPTPGHNMLNLGLNYQNHTNNLNYLIFLNANNLLNEKVYAHETYLPYIPQIGRNVSLGVNVSF
ncbi:putative TonB-dependent receptor [Moraxella macacae 0408225]|uniref:Putative TonB-dependent receptor n=1 Tax=Moraxella macacae 0408225 TaxID=1230338 RepID=L2F8J7_9GAMM|nr:TonB-dependent receptor [Moraxella macacae]ELA09061.1 putative TonB-dependent receptor [Moraxella macacae 0408225]